MYLCVFVGRLTKNPDLSYGKDYGKESQKAIAHFTLAVDRVGKKEEEPSADFINCVAFKRRAEFVGDYFSKGMRVLTKGKIRNENYTNRAGEKVYSFSLLTDDVEFADGKERNAQPDTGGQNKAPASPEPKQPAGQASKPAARSASSKPSGSRPAPSRGTTGRAPAQRSAARRPAGGGDGFMNIPDGIEDEGLPFN